ATSGYDCGGCSADPHGSPTRAGSDASALRRRPPRRVASPCSADLPGALSRRTPPLIDRAAFVVSGEVFSGRLVAVAQPARELLVDEVQVHRGRLEVGVSFHLR